jgi:nucleotide-binding universal stress UspA family protein
LAEAESYLETRGVTATLMPTQGHVPTAILTIAADEACDLIVMGGYTATPIREVVLGSMVDQVLRESRRPILVCR